MQPQMIQSQFLQTLVATFPGFMKFIPIILMQVTVFLDLLDSAVKITNNYIFIYLPSYNNYFNIELGIYIYFSPLLNF